MQLKRLTHRVGRKVVLFAGACALLSTCWCSPMLAQSFSPYSEFQAMTLTDLATLQVKLTYTGKQRHSRPSLVFTANGNVPSHALMGPYLRSGVNYLNDAWAPLTFTATVQELKAMIDGVGLLPSVTDGDVDPGAHVSFTLLNTSGGTTRCFEAVVNTATGALLFGKLLDAFETNPTGREKIWTFGCRCWALPTALPEDLASRVSIKFSGLRRDPSEKSTYVGQVRVTNTSTGTIVPPLSLVVIRQGNAELIEFHRTTCNIVPRGTPYVDLFIGGGLGPGASIDQVIRFTNPSRDKFEVTFRAFGGQGTR